MGYNLSIEALAAGQKTEEELLASARDAYPDWEIIETFGGYLAAPAGTVILQSTTIDGLAGKIRARQP